MTRDKLFTPAAANVKDSESEHYVYYMKIYDWDSSFAFISTDA